MLKVSGNLQTACNSIFVLVVVVIVVVNPSHLPRSGGTAQSAIQVYTVNLYDLA